MSGDSGRSGVRFIGYGLVVAGAALVGAIALLTPFEEPRVLKGELDAAFAAPPAEVTAIDVGRDGGPPPGDDVLALEAVDHAAEASALIQAGDHEGAVRELRYALERSPDDVSLHEKLAMIADGRTREQALRDVARLRPEDAEPMRELARVRLDAGDEDEALAAANEAIRRAPRSWEAHQLKGRALLGKGQLGAAIASLRVATKQPGAPSFPFNNLGYALLLANRPTDALDALDTAIDRGPVTHFMMNNLGLAYEKLGRYEDAELAFLGALELKDDYVKASVNLQRIAEVRAAIAAKEAEGAGEGEGAGVEDATAEGVDTGEEEEPELIYGG